MFINLQDKSNYFKTRLLAQWLQANVKIAANI